MVGAALFFKFRDEPRSRAAFFGDGATNIGTFHESLNLAQLWQVPVIFVCENNRWAESMPASQQPLIDDLTKRAAAYGWRRCGSTARTSRRGLPGRAVRRTRPRTRGPRPVFLLLETYRLTGHYVGDPQVYRPKEELKQLRGDAGPDHEAPRAPEPLRRGVRGCRPGDQRARGGVSEFAKAGTDPKPEDALKNLYARRAAPLAAIRTFMARS